MSSGKNRIVTVRLTEEQYTFLMEWKKKKEDFIGIDVPIGALVRKVVNIFMRQNAKSFQEEKVRDEIFIESKRVSEMETILQYQKHQGEDI